MDDIYSVEHYTDIFNDMKFKFGNLEYSYLIAVIEALAEDSKCEAILNAIKAFDIAIKS